MDDSVMQVLGYLPLVAQVVGMVVGTVLCATAIRGHSKAGAVATAGFGLALLALLTSQIFWFFVAGRIEMVWWPVLTAVEALVMTIGVVMALVGAVMGRGQGG